MRKYHPDGALPQIPVWGPSGTARRLAKAYDLDEDPGMSEEFDFITYGRTPFTYGPFTITVRRRTPRDGVRHADLAEAEEAGADPRLLR